MDLTLPRLKLKTIVSLTPSAPNKDLQQFCNTHKIISKHFKVDKFREEDSKVQFTSDMVAEILQVPLLELNSNVLGINRF
jgi:hypothetical protein